MVSYLTYVRVNKRWNYEYLLVDLFNREIMGYSARPNKDSPLVYKALTKVQTKLDEIIDTFKIKRSLSMKGCPYDNAVAKGTFKIIQIKFAYNYHFENLDQLEVMLGNHVKLFNNIRINSTLNYLRPKEYTLHNLIRLSK